MSYTVQDVIDAARRDCQNLIGSNHAALIDYCDRIHTDILRQSRWEFMLTPVKTFNTVAAQSLYWLGSAVSTPASVQDSGLHLTDFGQLKDNSVYDRTNRRQLTRVNEIPPGMMDKNDAPIQMPPAIFIQSPDTPLLFSLYPTPNDVYKIEFRYYKAKTHLTTVGDTSLIPDDYKDVHIAGVAYLASKYLKKYDDATAWNADYRAGLVAIRRDYNLFPKIDFIRPC